MSKETLTAVHDAIAAHLAEKYGDQKILTDFFIGYALADAVPDEEGRWGSTLGYMTSPTTPHGTFGIGTAAVAYMANDIRGGGGHE